MEHSAEFMRCLEQLDVRGIRSLWQHVSPHLHQPASDDEAVHTMHLARASMVGKLRQDLIDYSKTWLKERETTRVAHAVGIAVGMRGAVEPWRVDKLLNVRGEMEHAVTTAVQDGVDLDLEAPEVKKRIMTAREKAL